MEVSKYWGYPEDIVNREGSALWIERWAVWNRKLNAKKK